MAKVLLLSVLFLCSAVVDAQVLPAFGGSRSGTTGLQFLKLGPDARSNALAGSVVGEINDGAAAFWNPAGLVEMDTQKIHIQTGNTQYFAGVSMNHAAVIFQPVSYRSFGFSLMNMRSPEMVVTTEFMPKGTGQSYLVNDLMLAFTYSQVLTDNFRFGVGLKYANENIAGIVSQAGLFDFGFQYKIGIRDLMFGVAISNFGFNVNPQGEISLVNLRSTDIVDEFEEVSVPASFKMGFSGTAFEKGIHHIKANLQLNHPTDNQESVSMGLEYSRNKLLFVRGGYALGQDGNYPTFGIGLDLPRRFGELGFDYAFIAKNNLGFSQQFTLSIAI